MRIRERLEKMGLDLPEPFVYPSKNRTGCVVTVTCSVGHPHRRISGKVRGKWAPMYRKKKPMRRPCGP